MDAPPSEGSQETARRPVARKAPPERCPIVWALLICATLLATSGCTNLREYVSNGFKVGPNYRRPPAPVKEDWIDANDRRVRQESDNLAVWWTVFHDPTLDRLIDEAYRQNLTLREAGFRVLRARAELGYAVGSFFPQVQNAVGGYKRSGLSLNAPNREFLGERFFSQWSGGFALAWELDFWGRFRRAIEMADNELNASVEDYDDVLVTLLGDVANDYVQIRTLEQQIAFARMNVALQRETLGLAQARFQGGTASELDVDQAQSTLSQTESTIPQLEIQLRQTGNALCILLGIPPQDMQARLGPGPIPTAPPEVAAGIPADLLRRRPDVRREERRAAAQCARIGIAEADFYPAISLVGSIGYQSQQFPSLFESNSFNGSVGPSFQWKILNYGRVLNTVRMHEARFQELVAKYQNTVLNAQAEVENGLVSFLKAQERYRALVESVRAAERAVQVSIVQYKGGIVDFNRVSLLQQNLVQQQNLMAESLGEIAEGLIQVYRAMGGGWEIRLAPMMMANPAPPGAAPPQAPVNPPSELVPPALPPLLENPTTGTPSK